MAAVLQQLSSAELPASAPVRQRLELFDFARLVAIYSIVWLHTLRSPQLVSWTVLGRFAVPFFAAGAAFFVLEGLRRQPQRSIGEYAWGRVRRIYLPFLAWSGIYLVFKIVKSALLPDQPDGRQTRQSIGLLGGTNRAKRLDIGRLTSALRPVEPLQDLQRVTAFGQRPQLQERGAVEAVNPDDGHDPGKVERAAHHERAQGHRQGNRHR